MLIRPYFKAKYTDKWASIESTFIADARFLVRALAASRSGSRCGTPARASITSIRRPCATAPR